MASHLLLPSAGNGACEYLKRSIATPTAPIKAFNGEKANGTGNSQLKAEVLISRLLNTLIWEMIQQLLQ